MNCKHNDSKSMTCLTAQPRKIVVIVVRIVIVVIVVSETTGTGRFWAKCSHKPWFLTRVSKRQHGK